MSRRVSFTRCLVVAVCSAVTVVAAGDPPDVVHILHEWELASHDRSDSAEPTWTEETDALSVHEREAATTLCGPVDARSLIRQFEWTADHSAAGEIILTAIPRDPLVRLFFASVTIEFGADVRRPRRLTFRAPQVGERSIEVAAATVTTAGVESELVDSRPGVIQAAALSEGSRAAAAPGVPTIADVLTAWSGATAAVERAELEFVRYNCDLIAGTEERCAGRFHFERPDVGVYELRPAEIPDGARSERTAVNGEPLTVTAGPARLYVWDGGRLIVARPDERQYEDLPVPRLTKIQPVASFDRAWHALATPQRALPATVDVDSDGYLERFDWSLLHHDERRLILLGRPVSESDQLEISELQVILDPSTWRTLATRLISGDRERETVHVLKWVGTNNEVAAGGWRPDLSGYTALDPAPQAPPAEIEPALLPAAE